MTLEQRAEKIARECITPHCAPLYVATTPYQTDKVVAHCAAQVLVQLKELLEETHIKFE